MKHIIKNTSKFSTQPNLNNSWEEIHEIWGHLGEVSAGLLVTEKTAEDQVLLQTHSSGTCPAQPESPSATAPLLTDGNCGNLKSLSLPQYNQTTPLCLQSYWNSILGWHFVLKKDESTAMCVSVTTNMTKCRFSWERPLRRKQEYCNADGLDLLQILTNLSAGILFLTRLCYTTGSFEIELQIYLKSI